MTDRTMRALIDVAKAAEALHAAQVRNGTWILTANNEEMGALAVLAQALGRLKETA